MQQMRKRYRRASAPTGVAIPALAPARADLRRLVGRRHLTLAESSAKLQRRFPREPDLCGYAAT
jgi:hypothetical protein